MLPKFCPKTDYKIDLIWNYNFANPEFDYMNNNNVIGHNSLKTGLNDQKFIPMESLDIELQLW